MTISRASKIMNKLEKIVEMERTTNPEVEHDNYYIMISNEDANILWNYGNKNINKNLNKIERIFDIPVIISVYLIEPQLIGRMWKNVLNIGALNK